MTRLYIPEISDSIKLTADWTFDLHREYRNSDVWDALECAKHPALKAFDEQVRRTSDECKQIMARGVTEVVKIPIYQGMGHYKDFSHNVRKPQPAEQENYDKLQDWLHDSHTPAVPVTLPAGTILGVDRIYIRKGASDYSSLTFYVQETSIAALTPAKKKGGGFKKGRRRFWAKLSDVNTIEFEPLP